MYEAPTQPVFWVTVRAATSVDFRGADWTASRQLDRVGFDTGALPHFEQPDVFFRALDDFLD